MDSNIGTNGRAIQIVEHLCNLPGVAYLSLSCSMENSLLSIDSPTLKSLEIDSSFGTLSVNAPNLEKGKIQLGSSFLQEFSLRAKEPKILEVTLSQDHPKETVVFFLLFLSLFPCSFFISNPFKPCRLKGTCASSLPFMLKPQKQWKYLAGKFVLGIWSSNPFGLNLCCWKNARRTTFFYRSTRLPNWLFGRYSWKADGKALFPSLSYTSAIRE